MNCIYSFFKNNRNIIANNKKINPISNSVIDTHQESKITISNNKQFYNLTKNIRNCNTLLDEDRELINILPNDNLIEIINIYDNNMKLINMYNSNKIVQSKGR